MVSVKFSSNMVLYGRCTGLFLLFSVCGLCNFAVAVDRIRLRDVEVLTLYKNKMTTGRRSSPVPQLKCTGGSAGCSSFIPRAVQCYNRGWDGYDVQWECKTDMDNKYRFGHIQVNCEGYDYPDDPYILRGSCGLEYTIELTEEGYEKRRSSNHDSWNNYHHGNGFSSYSRRSRHSYDIGDLVMLGIVGFIVYMIYSTCTRHRQPDNGTPPPTAPPPYSEEPGFRSAYPQGHGMPPPPYAPDEPGFKREYTQGTTFGTTSSTPNTSSNYGFWSGAGTGGLLGYLFGRATSGNAYRHSPYGGGWGSPYNGNSYYRDSSGWFGNWFGGTRSYSHRPSNQSYGFSSFGSSSRSSSGSRTTSGMGGTSRR